MSRALNLRGSIRALVAAAAFVGWGVTPGAAADLGSDCCADLEERIAELEATTARKGNRKVSLTVGGQVNEALFWWDDGSEDNAYISTNDSARTRFNFKGDAKISSDLKAGYLIEVGIRAGRSNRWTQDDDSGVTQLLDIRHSYWFLDSKSYGRLSVGLTSDASDGITEINQAATKDIAKFSDVEDTGLGLFANDSDGNRLGTFQWRRLIRDVGNQPGEGRRSNLVRYDTPELAGFTGTASWGEDDFWTVALKYKGDFSGLQVAAGIAYGEASESNVSAPAELGGATIARTIGFECVVNGQVGGNNIGTASKDADCEQLGGSISVLHTDTGLYLNAGAGYLKDNLTNNLGDGGAPLAGFGGLEDLHYFYAFEAGIEKKWNSLGKTTLFAQYHRNEGGATARSLGTGNGRVLSSELDVYSIGAIQGIDAAALHLYLFYRHHEGEIESTTRDDIELDDVDVVVGGALIKF
ncbi:MAG: hypothetical protein CTY31_13930 [Hyphomicrobium sp.]|nr:MAG: hypothetical protein CTY31_13930 [Hyphomicrobium sp.]